MKPGELESALAAFASEVRWDSLPAATRTRVVDLTIDAIASAIAGATEGLGPVRRTAAALGAGESTVIGGEPLSMAGATMLNGHLITAVTVCDVYRPALCHVMPEVLPPALAVAEANGSGGLDFLAAIAAGVELTVRIGLAVDYPTFRRNGWHSPGVIGPFGGAAAADRLLDPEGAHMLDAIGLAGSQSAGTFAGLGTPAIKFHQGRGALSGLLAGLMASAGYAGSHAVLTGEDGGMLSAYAGGGTPEAALDGLGEDWELERISMRRWPVASSLQAVVASLLEWTAETGVEAEAVEAVEIGLPSEGYALCAEMKPTEALAARQAPGWVAAVCLHDRRCWLEQFDEERLADAALHAFAAERVAVAHAPELPTGGAALGISMRDGSTVGLRREVAPGDPGDPLAREAIREKFLLAARSQAKGEGEPGRAALAAVETLAEDAPVAAATAALGAALMAGAPA